LTGGKSVGNKGYYIEPTIFSNIEVNNKSTINFFVKKKKVHNQFWYVMHN